VTTLLPTADLDHVFAHTATLWEALRGERVFITGGTGFFGRWLVGTFVHANRMLDLGASITVLTRDPARVRAEVPALAADQSVVLMRGDVRELEPDGERYACVIHAATESSRIADPDDHLQMFDTVVLGTRRAFDFAVAARARRALLVSTGAVYGAQPPEMPLVDEDYRGAPDVADPRSAYAEGKRSGEVMASIFAARGLGVSSARCFAFVGPHLPLDRHFAVGNFVRDALAGGPIRLKGDGSAVRSYLYAADLAIWLWTIALRGAPGRPYNVGAERAVSIADLAEIVAEAVGTGCRVERPSVGPTGHVHRYVPSTRSARAELGLDAWIPLEEALGRTIAWHRDAAALASA
jgi:dTDP-glucose 4,6-dehydratase